MSCTGQDPALLGTVVKVGKDERGDARHQKLGYDDGDVVNSLYELADLVNMRLKSRTEDIQF